ncbi:MAG: hypothetical protein NVSMB17_07940 [Candidatus Dormibacteria bacterium]
MSRPRARALAALAVVSFLSACSVGGVKAPAAAVPPPGPASTAQPPLVYAAVGASETLGSGARQTTTDAWPQVFYRTALPRAAVYYNFGLSGDTVSGAQTDQVPGALGVDPTLVTVWLNVNDLLAGVTPARYQLALSKLVHDLRRGGAAQVMVANTPFLDRLPAYLACHGGAVAQCPPGPVARLTPAALNALVDAYNAAIETVVREEGAALVDLHARGETPDLHPEWVSADGFHPTTAGHAAIAAAFAERYRALARGR